MRLNDSVIFVVGNSRSGTTMLSRILGNNKEVHSFQEIHFFEWMVSPQKINNPISKKEAVNLLNKLIGIQVEGFYKQVNLSKYTKESIGIIKSIGTPNFSTLEIYQHYLLYWVGKMGKSIPCEQTPKNIYYIEEILSKFENGKILNMVRDPRAILISQKNKWRRKYLGEPEMPFLESVRAWTLYHPITIARLWVSAINATKKTKEFAIDQILTVKFEQLLNDPHHSISEICAFCNLEYSPDMLDIPQVGSSIDKDETKKRGVDKNKSVTWAEGGISNTELYLIQKIAKGHMQDLGYECKYIRPNYLHLSYLYISFPVKIVIAILFNLGRMKNIFETLKRRIN